MSSDKAVGALLRWREFGELRNAAEFGRRSQEVRRAEAKTQADEARLSATRNSMVALLDGAIDPAVMQLAADIEGVIWTGLQASMEGEEAARTEEAAARAAYVEARAHTRVAQTRRSRLVAQQLDSAEKVSFDRLVDLHMQVRRQKRD